MKIVIANLASPANPGDHAILMGTLKLVKRWLKNCEITLVTRAISHKNKYKDLNCAVVPSYPDIDKISMAPILEKIGHIHQALVNPLPLYRAIAEADLIFLAGGAYFYSYRALSPGLTFLAHISPVFWGKVLQKKVIILPGSFGPFSSTISKRLFDYVVNRSNVIFFREKISGQWMAEQYKDLKASAAFMPDLALYLKSEDLLLKRTGNALKASGWIGVTIRPWHDRKKGLPPYKDELKKTLIHLHSKFKYKIRIIVQVQADDKEEGDEAVSRQLAEQMTAAVGSENIEFHTQDPYYSVQEISKLYRGCELLITMRLHSALLSYICGRPAFVVGYQHKAKGILESMGLSDLYIGDSRWIQAEDMIHAIERQIPERSNLTNQINTALNRSRQVIDQAFENHMDEILG